MSSVHRPSHLFGTPVSNPALGVSTPQPGTRGRTAVVTKTLARGQNPVVLKTQPPRESDDVPVVSNTNSRWCIKDIPTGQDGGQWLQQYLTSGPWSPAYLHAQIVRPIPRESAREGAKMLHGVSKRNGIIVHGITSPKTSFRRPPDSPHPMLHQLDSSDSSIELTAAVACRQRVRYRIIRRGKQTNREKPHPWVTVSKR